MHNLDKQAAEQVKATPNPQNGQRQATQPSAGVPPVPTPMTVVAAQMMAKQYQQQFNDLVVGYLVQGFVGSDVESLGAIGQAILEESIMALPLTVQEFRNVTPALPPAH